LHPKAKRVISLFQRQAGPLNWNVLINKPKLVDAHGQELPDSIGGKRVTGFTASSQKPIGKSFVDL